MNSLEHIISQYYVDKFNNPQSEHIVKDYQISPNYNHIILEGIVDEFQEIEVDGLYRVYNFDEITQNSFYVRSASTIYFHPSMQGKTVRIDWHCIGVEYLNVDKIYTELDLHGNIIKTLADYIQELKDTIYTLKDIKEIEKLIPLLEQKMLDGGQMHNSLTIAVSEAEDKLNKLNKALGKN